MPVKVFFQNCSSCSGLDITADLMNDSNDWRCGVASSRNRLATSSMISSIEAASHNAWCTVQTKCVWRFSSPSFSITIEYQKKGSPSCIETFASSSKHWASSTNTSFQCMSSFNTACRSLGVPPRRQIRIRRTGFARTVSSHACRNRSREILSANLNTSCIKYRFLLPSNSVTRDSCIGLHGYAVSILSAVVLHDMAISFFLSCKTMFASSSKSKFLGEGLWFFLSSLGLP